jgi:DUF4097 and DUF4098 domain-containing protein YvlB
VSDDILRVRIETKSGSVRLNAVEGAELQVHGGEIRGESDGWVLIKGGSRSLDVQVPSGTDIIIGTLSGSVEMRGWVGSARVSSKSGSIEVDRAQDLDARTTSGSVRVSRCDGECRVVVVSGSVRIGRAGHALVSGVSGTIQAEKVDAADVKTVSGTTELGANAVGRVAVRSISGTVRISVPQDRSPATRLQSVSGSIRCDCDQGSDGELDVKTVSGTIRVACA